jgi:capsular polysaccharide transport system permease protein
VQTELYQSSSTVLIKDLKPSAAPSDMLSAIMPTNSSNMQESKLLEKFISSSEMFMMLDKRFSLRKHYQSEALDILQRKYTFSSFADFLALYQKRLSILYDESSSTLDISFFHTDPVVAREILDYILVQAEKKLNMYDKENGNELLDFIKRQEKQNKKILIDAIEKLLDYQNNHKTINPSIDIKAKSAILARLETRLVQKEIEYANLKQYMNPKSVELKTLSGEIVSLKKKLFEVRSELSGSGRDELNENLFEFEQLRADVEFSKERYKQTLIQLDMAMIQATQNAKNLIIVLKPTLSDDYSEPNKIKNIITLFLVLFMVYGIVTMIYAIIKDHRD